MEENECSGHHAVVHTGNGTGTCKVHEAVGDLVVCSEFQVAVDRPVVHELKLGHVVGAC